MSDIETTTVSEDGFATTGRVGDFELSVDATGETGPEPNQALVATYAACYLPAFRVAADEAGHDDLGRVQIDASADLDDEDDLAAVRFAVHVAADLGPETLGEIAARAEEICHVDSALRDDLRADVTADGDAF